MALLTATVAPTKAVSVFTDNGGGKKPIIQTTTDQWTLVRLTLETAGNVNYGTTSDIAPVISSGGCILTAHIEKKIILAPGTQLFLQSDSVNRVSMVTEPIPAIEIGKQVIMLLTQLVNAFAASRTPISGSRY